MLVHCPHCGTTSDVANASPDQLAVCRHCLQVLPLDDQPGNAATTPRRPTTKRLPPPPLPPPKPPQNPRRAAPAPFAPVRLPRANERDSSSWAAPPRHDALPQLADLTQPSLPGRRRWVTLGAFGLSAIFFLGALVAAAWKIAQSSPAG